MEKTCGGEKCEARRGNVLLSAGVFAGILVAVAALSFALGAKYKNVLSGASAIVSKTFSDMFHSPQGPRLVAEIPLGEPLGETSTVTVARNLKGNVSQGTSGKSGAASTSIQSGEKTKSAASVHRAAEIVTSSPAAPVPSPKNLLSVSQKQTPSECVFELGGSPTYRVIFNEIAWMGSPARSGESASAASGNEWMELRNVSGEAVNLSGWQITNQDGDVKIIFGEGEKIGAGSLYLLERTDDDSVPSVPADKIYSGGLSNGGEWLRFFNGTCELTDEMNASSGWPAGDNATKQTLERNKNDFGWHTSAVAGGTPKRENSESSSTLAQSIAQAARYTVSVEKSGSGAGTVTSAPDGLNCGLSCSYAYASGTALALSATPGNGSLFAWWTGACSGTSECRIVVAGTTTVGAVFGLSSSQATQTPTGQGGGHVIVTEVMAGSDTNSSYEFVELYNPTSQAVDLTGWSAKKRISTGSESSLVVASHFDGKSVGAGKYFLLANASSGILVVADVLWPQSYTLAYTNNAVALYDASGAKVDEVSWSEIPKGQSYERQPLGGNTFVVQPNPNPQNSAQ